MHYLAPHINPLEDKPMKNTLLATSLALAVSAASLSSYAEEGYSDQDYFEQENTSEITSVKGGVTFGAAAIIGGLIAGPIGIIVGSISGKFLGDELDKADGYDVAVAGIEHANMNLADATKKITALNVQLQVAQQQQYQMQALAMTNLEFQVLFHTGNDNLNTYTLRRLDELATFLERNPDLSLRLHGYADPRGTDEYNNVLSMYRAINVQKALEARGIDVNRIERHAYGADQSKSAKNDLDAYALDRRVTIEVFKPEQKNSLLNKDDTILLGDAQVRTHAPLMVLP
ncbi:MAG: outer membrane protein OmpA-like peptidoglycan-associated protein [Candidatus Endobugula sp.]|jgi:outer membrane protein OmpA-like peptidoglycan-associated protein